MRFGMVNRLPVHSADNFLLSRVSINSHCTYYNIA